MIARSGISLPRGRWLGVFVVEVDLNDGFRAMPMSAQGRTRS
jgi:hypothetical protein